MTRTTALEAELVGPYRILERLGRGGMGIVYRASHVRTGEVVAVKTVLVPSGRHLAAIRREIQALAQVHHPGVVGILNEGLDETGLPWYAMQLLAGTSLREYRFARTPNDGSTRDQYWAMNLASRSTRGVAEAVTAGPPMPRATSDPTPLSAEAIGSLLGTFRKLCAPLAYVHGEGLVHCDLKPENIFLRNDGHPVLVDFGLISRFGSGMHREVLDVDLFMGTAEYMAPEQWEGKPVDARTDLYALGCIIYEAIAGRPPFSGDRQTLYRAHMQSEPPELITIAPNAPQELDELLYGLLRKRPQDRIGHADEVARRLAMLGAEGPREIGPTPRPYLFRPAFAGRGHATNEVIGLVSASGDDGRLVILEGESGVGKTRLAMEAARMARRGGIRVMTGECAPVLSSGGQGAVLHPFRTVLLHITDRVREDGAAAFNTLLNGRARILARIEPEIRLLRETAQLPRLVALSAEAERARMMSAVTETLAALGQERRTFLVLDDIQWADELTQELLHHLMRRPADWKNVVILATCRSEAVPPRIRLLTEADGVGHLRLARLGPRAVEAVATDMLGFPPPGDFSSFLAKQTGGNPFFVAEYLRAAMTSGLLMRDGQGKWTVTVDGDYASFGLPNTLLDLLALRLDTLGPEARTYVESVAVFGREATAELVELVSRLSGHHARQGVEELLRKQILEEALDGQLRFAHDKLREVAYDRIPHAHRQQLHRLAAETIEAEIVEPSPAALAYHWEEAKNAPRAIDLLEEAADLAISAGAHLEAASFLYRILRLAEPPGVDRGERRRAATWHRKLGEAHLAGGNLVEARRESELSLQLVDHPTPETTGGWVARLGVELIRQLVHRALPPSTYEEPGHRNALSEATQASGTLARIAFFENDPLQIVAGALWSINLAERAGHLVEAARNYSGLGWVFGLTGMHRVADSYFLRARKTGLETNDWSGLIFSLTSEAVYRIGRAQWDLANDALSACDEPCAITGDPQAKELVETLRAHPEFFSGRFEAAISRHRFVLDSARTRQNPQHEAWSLYCSARSSLALGRFGEAIEELESAAKLLEDQTDQMSLITCQGLLASARCRAGDLEGAIAAARAAQEAIGRKAPTVFLTLHGYEGIVEVALAQLAAGGENKTEQQRLKREANSALSAFNRAAKTFPVGAPRVAYWRSRLASILGDRPRAKRALEHGISDARTLQMPHEVYSLQKELAAPQDSDRT